jgi:teichuronic acid biosynthesis glycosyltransferase TuaG
MQPKVSIITPAYNAAKYLSGTITSVRSQTFTEWEWLLVDDASTDGTADLIAAAAAADPRIIEVAHGANAGAAAARNSGLDAARREWIAFIDADDVWVPRKLERQLEGAARRNADFCYTSYRRMDESGSRLSEPVAIPDSLDYDAYLRNTAIALSSSMLRRRVIGDIRFPAELRHHEDLVFWLAVFRRGVTAHAVHEPLLHYRVRPGSLSSNHFSNIVAVWRIYRDYQDMGVIHSLRCLSGYGARAVWKRTRRPASAPTGAVATAGTSGTERAA